MKKIRHQAHRPILRSLALIPRNGSGILYATPSRRGQPAVALTFDDGPSPANTAELLDLLRSRGARATFFVVGERAAARAELALRIAGEGHELGNHTNTHRRSTGLSREELGLELEAAQEAIATASGYRPRLARPPFGKDVRRFARVASGLGLRTALWSVDSGDTWGYPADAVARFVGRARNGDVVLMHDGAGRRPTTLEGTERALETLASRGFRCVTLSELIAGG